MEGFHPIGKVRPYAGSRFGSVIPTVVENATTVALRILVLAASQSVNKSTQSNYAEHEGYRNQIGQYVHRQIPRKAFSETVIEESDIASAAIRGVASPATASGTATIL